MTTPDSNFYAVNTGEYLTLGNQAPAKIVVQGVGGLQMLLTMINEAWREGRNLEIQGSVVFDPMGKTEFQVEVLKIVGPEVKA